jgi:crotonobetainyl-CoA:carnitine CoA-transferase CaiB-like acyl-CoA transferase
MLGGIFGAIGILVSLRERDRGKGGAVVESALFETAVFLMGQFMAYSAIVKQPVPPMPARISAWGVYDLFEAADGRRVFVGVTSDAHWKTFCREVGRADLLADPALSTNEKRVDARSTLIPMLGAMFKTLPSADIERRCVAAMLPFAFVAHPEDLFDDPQLNANGGLFETTLPGGIATKLPSLPIRIDGEAFALRSDPPAAGADTADILGRLRTS